jgi:hypothetical protein
MAKSVGGSFFGWGEAGNVAREIYVQGRTPHSYWFFLTCIRTLYPFSDAAHVRSVPDAPGTDHIRALTAHQLLFFFSIGVNLILTVTAVFIDYAIRVFVLLGGIHVVRGVLQPLVESNNEASHIG